MEQLNLSNISYTTLDKEIFHSLSLTIPKGSGVSIIGPSGSGKTTLARILAGRIRYRGSIKINGVEIVRSNLYLLRRYVAVVFHDKYVNKNTVINELFDSMNDLNLELEEEEVTEDSQKFAGVNFVITGSVEHFANRAEVKAEIEKRGGKVTGSVTSKTNYLINNDVNSTSSKNKKARDLGVPIISEKDFLEML